MPEAGRSYESIFASAPAMRAFRATGTVDPPVSRRDSCYRSADAQFYGKVAFFGEAYHERPRDNDDLEQAMLWLATHTNPNDPGAGRQQGASPAMIQHSRASTAEHLQALRLEQRDPCLAAGRDHGSLTAARRNPNCTGGISSPTECVGR